MTNEIILKNVWHIKDIVRQLSFLNKLKKGDTANIRLDLNVEIIMPQYLSLIVSAITDARYRGVKVNISFPEKAKKNSYASRLDFYKLLGIKNTELFYRRNSDGNFIEITQMSISGAGTSDSQLVNKIIKIFESHYKVEKSVLSTLNFCLWEIIDNIKNHSNGNHKYTFVAQYFPKKEEIRLCISDNGIGIFNALTKTQGTRFSYLTAKEALEKCTELNVTDGKGEGYGLYSYKNFVKANKGHLVIYSGSYYQDVSEKHDFVKRGEYWQGTIIYNKIKTKNRVNLNQIFGKNIPTSVTEYKESINSLW